MKTTKNTILITGGTSVKVFEIIPPTVDSELGYQRRSDPGGMPVKEFIDETISAIGYDKFEEAVSESKNLREKGEALFSLINR
jgi:uncharacterized oxidoreductase